MSEIEGLKPFHKHYADRWFGIFVSGRSLSEREKRDYERDVRILGANVMNQLGSIAGNEGAKFRDAQAIREKAMEAKRARKFPEALINRDPKTRLTVISAHFRLKVDHETYRNSSVDPLVDVLMGNARAGYEYGGAGVNNPNRADELEVKNINFITIDDRHFEYTDKSDSFYWKIKHDEYSADTLIAMFGLSEEEHGGDEVVLMYDPSSRQSLNDLAESVKDRIGKYPYIGVETQPLDPYEGHAKWDVYEYVTVPTAPERPTLGSALGTLLVDAS